MKMVLGIFQNYPDLLLFTLGSGFVILMIICCYWHWRQKCSRDGTSTEKTYESTQYDDFSQCNLPGCVRCQNYGGLTSDLLEQFTQYRDGECDHEEQTNLLRLQLSIEKNWKYAKNKLHFSQNDVASLQNPNVFTLCGLHSNPWYEREFISERAVLEEALPTIKQEYQELLTEQNLAENFEGWLDNSVPDGMWSVFYLFNQGKRVEDNCARCPKTVAVLDNLEAFMRSCAFGNAMFSVLEAGTHITAHYGPCNLRIRCHLGLHVPPKCTLTVANQSKEWQEGKCILFDDSFLHEARHDGSEDKGPRVVLMIDLWHPDVTEVEKKALYHIFSLK